MKQSNLTPKTSNMEISDQLAELQPELPTGGAIELLEKIQLAGSHYLLIVGSKLRPSRPIIVTKLLSAYNRGNAHDPNWQIVFWSLSGRGYFWDQETHGGHTEIITEDELIEMLEGC